MNRRIRQLAFGLMAAFVLLFAAINYWQVGRESDLNAMADNTRSIRRDFARPRGQIITRDGIVVAESVPTGEGADFPFQRVYPYGTMFADLTGYYSLPYGASQIEFTEDDVLTGSTGVQRIGNLNDIITGGDGTGSVRLTIDFELQQLAQQQLEGNGYHGSVVMIDTQTGAVLAMYSSPSFDPNTISTLDFEAADVAINALLDDPANPLLAESYQDREMPGSTFKVLTTSMALEQNAISLDSSWPDASEWEPPQTNDPIENYNGSVCGGDLYEVFTRSCNIPFAQIAVEDLGIDPFVTGAESWGVGETIPFDLPRPAASTIGSVDDLDQNLPLLAMRGFGQNEVQMVPLHMALIAGGVANGGVMLKPYVVDATLDSDGEVLEVTRGSREWLQPISRPTAEIMNTLMQGVAREGTASCCIALSSGLPVAAKTGTAQLNGPGEPERSNAWIVAYAPADAPRYAVAVVILGTSQEISASTGGRLAGPIAKRMLDLAIAREL